MSLLRRLFRSPAGQTTAEYMVLISVVAIGAMAAFAIFVNKDGPVQTAENDLAKNFSQGLTNGDQQTMHVNPR